MTYLFDEGDEVILYYLDRPSERSPKTLGKVTGYHRKVEEIDGAEEFRGTRYPYQIDSTEGLRSHHTYHVPSRSTLTLKRVSCRSTYLE